MQETDLKCSSLFVNQVHTIARQKLMSHMFQVPTEVCTLSFIGASDFMISEFGAIWNRRRIYLNRKGLVTKGFLPLVHKDPSADVYFTLIPTTMGKLWFPVNQLLGWAFRPTEDKSKPFFTPKSLGKLRYPDDHEWTACPPELPENSYYKRLVESIYETR